LGLDQGVGILVWSPLAGGFLSGKYRRNQPAPEGTRNGLGAPPLDMNKLYDIVVQLVHGRDRRRSRRVRRPGGSRLTLARPGVASAIVGARTMEQLADNLAAAQLQLSDDELSGLEQASRHPLRYPHWHQVAAASDRLSPADLAHLAPHLEG
jgi:aryl-alcohol dehydrogenase-like predicted oxidoreductase